MFRLKSTHMHAICLVLYEFSYNIFVEANQESHIALETKVFNGNTTQIASN